MIKKLFKLPNLQTEEERKNQLYQSLVRHEAKIGGELFGPAPAGGRREFFCLDESTWVWHEEWVDKSGSLQRRTTRYDVRSDGVLKSQNGNQYQRISDIEYGRLIEAVTSYERRVKKELYQAVA